MRKTKARLVEEVEALERRVAELETTVAGLDGGARAPDDDVAEIRQRERQLRESQQQLKLVTDALPALISYVGRDQRWRFNNRAYERWFGLDPDRLRGTHIRDGLGEEAYAVIRGYVERALAGETVAYEAEMPYARGGARHVEAVHVPDIDERGEVQGFFSLVTDVTERKRMEEALRESEKQLRLVMDAVPALIAYVDAGKRYRFVNRTYEEWARRSRDDLIGRNVWEVLGEEAYRGLQPHIDVALSGDSVKFEQELTFPDGRPRHLDIRYVPDFGDDRQVLGFYVLGTDITERKRAEDEVRRLNEELEQRVRDRTAALTKANEQLLDEMAEREQAEKSLRESEERFRAVVDNAPMAFLLKDSEGRYRLVNRRFEEWFCGEGENPIGKIAHDFIPKEQADGLARQDEEVLRTLATIEREHEVTFKDDSLHTIAVTKFPVLDDRGRPMGLGNLSIDITERKRAEEALRLQAIIMQNMAEGVSLVRVSDGVFVYTNEITEKILGYARMELVGKHVSVTNAPTIKNPEEVFTEISQALIENGIWSGEVQNLRKDGTEVWCHYNVTTFDHPEYGEVWLGVMEDITERKRAEEELSAAKEQAELANRAKSEFLSTMSHELRTPLNAIIGFSETMKMEIFGALGNDKYREYSDDILESARHLLSIIEDVLDLSKIEAGEARLDETAVDVEEAAESCLRLIRARAENAGLSLEAHIAEGLPELRADERALKQILLNLLSNAVKFTPEGGRVTLRADRDAGGRMFVSVADTGIGIAEADLEKVMGSFVQVESALSRRHTGTGLGLPIARKLVELHGGEMTLDSEEGAGTTVTVTFPMERVI